MNKHINEIVELLFSDIPYSKKSEDAKSKIGSAMNDELLKAEEDGQNEIRALGGVMSRRSTLEEASESAGIGAQELESLADDSQCVSKKDFVRLFRTTRFIAIIISWLCSGFVNNIILAIFAISIDRIISAVIGAAVTVPLFLLFRKKCRLMDYESIRLIPEVKKCFDKYYDRYKKRTVNSFLLLVGAFTVVESLLIVSVMHGNINYSDFSAMIESNSYILMIGILICVKNILYLVFLGRAVCTEKRRELKKYLTVSGIICAVYLVAATVLTCVLGRFIPNEFSVFYILSGIFIAAFAAVNFKKREKLVKNNLCINKPRVIIISLASVVALTLSTMRKDVYTLQPFISTVSQVEHTEHDISYDDGSGVYTIKADDGDFKILHLTDIHIGGSVSSTYKDYKALNACYNLIEYSKPDFVVITGDLVFPMGIMSLSLNNQSPVTQFADFMRNIGIPWAFTFGNHDTESMATGTREDICALYESLSFKKTGSRLLYPCVQPDITGRCNQMIKIENPDGTVRQALFLIDSNDYTGNGINDYDYIHDDQVDWYEEQVNALSADEGKTVPSMIFFHIPLQEYRTAYNLYQQNSPEVKYEFGEIGETMINAICCSDYPSRLFESAVKLSSTKAMFCGHDHYNNISLEYKGIRLTYGMSIDYLAMPGIDKSTKQRGAELITIHPDSEFEIQQLKLTDIK